MSHTVKVLTAAVGCVLALGVSNGRAQAPITLDPCVFAPADALEPLLSAQIVGFFPVKAGKPGQRVTIAKPSVREMTCQNPLNVVIRANIRYQKTRGVPQFSTSGTMRFGSPLVARVTLGAPGPGGTPTVERADACLTRISVSALDLKRVPNWLDDTWVRDRLDRALGDTACFDVTRLVTAYLQSGGQL